MNEDSKFALVPRAPSALEKTEPGAKRILSGIVTDTLALARKQPVGKRSISVLLGFGSSEGYKLFAEGVTATIGKQCEVRFIYFETKSELLRAAQQESIDLIIAFCGQLIDWKTAAEDSVKVVELLENVAQSFRKPIIVPHNFDKDLEKRLKAAGIETFPGVFSTIDFWSALQDRLNVPRWSALNRIDSAIAPRQGTLRIVMLDDEPTVLQSLKLLFGWFVKEAAVVTFTDAEEALQELEREEPDLFTTDSAHPGMRASEMLRILSARKVNYPIFVLSAFARAEHVLLWGVHHADVTLVPKPFSIDDLLQPLSRHFGPTRVSRNNVAPHP
jgi:CheY-like chemotaxis protein